MALQLGNEFDATMILQKVHLNNVLDWVFPFMHTSYPESHSLSVLKAHNAMNWSGNSATSLYHNAGRALTSDWLVNSFINVFFRNYTKLAMLALLYCFVMKNKMKSSKMFTSNGDWTWDPTNVVHHVFSSEESFLLLYFTLHYEAIQQCQHSSIFSWILLCQIYQLCADWLNKMLLDWNKSRHAKDVFLYFSFSSSENIPLPINLSRFKI